MQMRCLAVCMLLCSLFVADLIVGMEELELHYRRRGRYNFRKIRIVTISVRMVFGKCRRQKRGKRGWLALRWLGLGAVYYGKELSRSYCRYSLVSEGTQSHSRTHHAPEQAGGSVCHRNLGALSASCRAFGGRVSTLSHANRKQESCQRFAIVPAQAKAPGRHKPCTSRYTGMKVWEGMALGIRPGKPNQKKADSRVGLRTWRTFLNLECFPGKQGNLQNSMISWKFWIFATSPCLSSKNTPNSKNSPFSGIDHFLVWFDWAGSTFWRP